MTPPIEADAIATGVTIVTATSVVKIHVTKEDTRGIGITPHAMAGSDTFAITALEMRHANIASRPFPLRIARSHGWSYAAPCADLAFGTMTSANAAIATR